MIPSSTPEDQHTCCVIRTSVDGGQKLPQCLALSCQIEGGASDEMTDHMEEQHQHQQVLLL